MIIDAHLHFGLQPSALTELLAEHDLKLLNICVATDELGDWREQAATYRALAQMEPRRYAWCTTFDVPTADDFHHADAYVERVIHGLRRDFASGAVACKIWKNIGMAVRTPEGDFVMPDDPLFAPILDFLADNNHTLLTHIAEPLDCWLPLRAESPHYGYYSRHPQWHMHNRADFPSHAELMQARDNVLAHHPTLRHVGAHNGSLSHDVDEVAARLHRYPNFAVDVSARLLDLALQDASKVRRLFTEFPDRILFGTDVVLVNPGAMSADERAQASQRLCETYATHFAYFESKGTVEVRGRTVQGLGLSAEVLEQFYAKNAQLWYPGL